MSPAPSTTQRVPARKALGKELAEVESLTMDADTIVVPRFPTRRGPPQPAWPTSFGFPAWKPDAQSLRRRTFIEGKNRATRPRFKYTPLPEVMQGKRVLLVEDTIVRSTTMKVLISQLREPGWRGKSRRVACPPILDPVSMASTCPRRRTVRPKFLNGVNDAAVEQRMADAWAPTA